MKNKKIVLIILASTITVVFFLISNNLDNSSNKLISSKNIDNQQKDENQITFTANGEVISIIDNSIEIGYTKEIIAHNIILNKDVTIISCDTKDAIQTKDIEKGDLIWVVGNINNSKNDNKEIEAHKVVVYKKEDAEEKMRDELIGKDFIFTSICYKDINENGEGYIIGNIILNEENYEVDNYLVKIAAYIKLKVTANTNTYLGRIIHLQDNYGYPLNEMVDITLDKPITDIKNITSIVTTAEFIAD